MTWACHTFVLALAAAVLNTSETRADMVVSLNVTAMAFDQAQPPRGGTQDQDFAGGAFGHGSTTSYTVSRTATAAANRASSSATASVRHNVEPDTMGGKLDYKSETHGIPYDFFSPYGSSAGSFGSFDFKKIAPRAGNFQVVWNATSAVSRAAINWFELGQGPGLYEMQLTGAGQSIVFEGGFQSIGTNESARFSLIWGFDGLPGSTIAKALIPELASEQRPDLTAIEAAIAGVAASVSAPGSFFTAPVTAGYGLDKFIYFDPEIATGYLYTVTGTRFAQFLMPGPLPGGDSVFQLYFDGAFHDYTAGQEFDFLAFNPSGISRFMLLGIDPSELIDTSAIHAPFVSGLKFTTEGVAEVWQVPLTARSAVPEPSSIALLGFGFVILLGCAQYRRIRVVEAA